jgi:hypothetical protein
MCTGEEIGVNISHTYSWASLSRKAVSITNCTFWCFGKTTLCSHEGTNRAWDEGSLCRVVPFKAFATLRGTSARYAAVVPFNTWYTLA